MTQETLMTHCPATGSEKPYPSHAKQWRKYHGPSAWLFNPWGGQRRNAMDVGSDPFGMGIRVEGEPIYAAEIGTARASGALSGGAMACCQNQAIPNIAQSGPRT